VFYHGVGGVDSASRFAYDRPMDTRGQPAAPRPRIVILQCSPRREGMTASLAESALRGAVREGADARLLHLADDSLQACASCGGDCWATLSCVDDQAATERAVRLQDVDGIVMAVPVYCWQLNGLTSLFIDKMRWDTGSVLRPANRRVAMGIACAGGSGTGCVLALQTLYKYFANWAFHGVAPLPVTRFNREAAIGEAEEGGALLARTARAGVEPFADLGEAMLAFESLPYMRWGPVDELGLVVRHILAGLERIGGPDTGSWLERAGRALAALEAGDRAVAAPALADAYASGAVLWNLRRSATS
jgi:multimeric flavodoxin WrbA